MESFDSIGFRLFCKCFDTRTKFFVEIFIREIFTRTAIELLAIVATLITMQVA